MTNYQKEKIKYLLALVISLSLIVVFSFIPDLGYIRYNYLTISIVSIIVIVSSIKNGYLSGAICGFAVGICFYFVVRDYEMNPSDAIYGNLLIAIIPKMFLGIIAVFFYRLIVNIFKIKWISAMISTLISLAVEVIITFLMAYILERPILVNVYDESNVLYLFFQYIQYATLIETAIITCVLGLLTAFYEYFFRNKLND